MSSRASELYTHRSILRPLRSVDVGPIFAMVSNAQQAGRNWRVTNGSADAAAFTHQFLTKGVLAQACIVSRSPDSEVLGLVQLLEANRRTASADLSVLLRQDLWESAWPLEGVLAFVDWSFLELGLSRIRIEMAESNEPLMRTLASWTDSEGCGVAGPGFLSVSLTVDKWRSHDLMRFIR